MAILAEMAYMRFGEEDLRVLREWPGELAAAAGQDLSDEDRRCMETELAGRNNTDNRLLRLVLQCGGFHLSGLFSDPKTHSQGFVTERRSGDLMDMTVVCFRGTENLKDWGINLRSSLVGAPDLDSRGTVFRGRVHRGFLEGFMSVKDQIHKLLEGAERAPIYLTGHSLGGALATLGAAYIPADRLAACYTFAAPRVSDEEYGKQLRAPLYRVVNPGDMVPRVPARWRGYRDLGQEKLLPPSPMRGFSRPTLERLRRICLSVRDRSPYRFYSSWEVWHNMSRYREKLREEAAASPTRK